MHLFDAFGIELEYMIVDRNTLDVRPIADRVLRDDDGEITSDVERGPIAWSHELTHHVIELKTNGPAADLAPLADQFQENVREINARLESERACLLPTGMHPWMRPDREMQLWPHDSHVIYEAFDRIFDCRGHGWANLQSLHINLPFAGDVEFGQLHAAIRLLLPILPGLAASSPLIEGRRTGLFDSRLEVYRTNATRIASMTGRVIPEPVYDRAAYDREILQPLFREIAPFDPGGVLRSEFLNARGAIARFGRGSIEIRVIDVQECPQADLAIAELTVAALRLLVGQCWTSTQQQQNLSIDALEPTLLATIASADEAVIENGDYLAQFGLASPVSVRDLWRRLHEAARAAGYLQQAAPALEVILEEGSLSRRILRALGAQDDRDRMADIYRQLAESLARGECFRAR